MLKVAEVFGPTFQGEGPSLGRRAAFLRLGRCNLACSWCDTPYTWDWEGQNGIKYNPALELYDGDAMQLAAQIRSMDVPLLVITGGEPMSQQRSLLPLVKDLAKAETMDFEIETNGTVMPLPDFEVYIDRFNVSPKLSNSNQPEANRIKPDVLNHLNATGRAAFKFVVTGPQDMDEIDDIVSECDIDAENIWIMGEGRSAAAVESHQESVIIDVLERGWNMTTRLHVLLWGDKRGV